MKKEKQEKRFFIGDIAVFLTILVFAAASFFLVSNRPSGDRRIAVITHDGVEIRRIALDKVTDRIEIKIDGIYNEIIAAEKGEICFLEADCPDRICVNTGWISKPGQVAVCVPEGVIIKITGDSDNEEADFYLR